MPHEPIPVRKAADLYAELGSWNAVAQVIKRENGHPWLPFSICNAVHRADKLGRMPSSEDELLTALRREHAMAAVVMSV